jgi:hypothetical protein
MYANDEVERRGNAATSIEAALSQSSTPSLAHLRCDPRDRSNRWLGNKVRSRLRAYLTLELLRTSDTDEFSR